MSGRLIKGAAPSLNVVAGSAEIQLLRAECQGVRLVLDPSLLDRLNRDAWLVGRRWAPIRPQPVTAASEKKTQ